MEYRNIAVCKARTNTFPARDLHRNYFELQDAVNFFDEMSVRTRCSVETIKREKKRYFQV